MNSNAFVLVKLSFTISNTGLVTHRVLNSTFFVFAGALLGAVFGLLGSVATLMSLVEGFTDKAKVRYLKDRKKKYLQTTRKILSDFFDHKILKNEASIIDKTPTEISAKVYPLDMSTKNDSFL